MPDLGFKGAPIPAGWVAGTPMIAGGETKSGPRNPSIWAKDATGPETMPCTTTQWFGMEKPVEGPHSSADTFLHSVLLCSYEQPTGDVKRNALSSRPSIYPDEPGYQQMASTTDPPSLMR